MEEQKLERLKKEREITRMAMRTVQAHEFQVLNIELKRFTTRKCI